MHSDPNNQNFTGIQSTFDYYPFGMGMPGRGYSGSGYDFGFNGKENDNEVYGDGNFQDYGMRMYDTRVGRFVSLDPITKKYPELTPYQFSSNRPIDGIDLEGLEWSQKSNGDMVFSAVLTNTSGKRINLYKARNEMVKQYKAMFGKGFEINIRVDYSFAEARDYEALIEIKSSDNFDKYEGGRANMKGRYIKMNAGFMNEEGKMITSDGIDNSVWAEEIGHLGGLEHPWEKKLNVLEKIGVDLGNFMSYPWKDAEPALSKKYSESGKPAPAIGQHEVNLKEQKKEFTENPSPASVGQKETIKLYFKFNLLNTGKASD